MHRVAYVWDSTAALLSNQVATTTVNRDGPHALKIKGRPREAGHVMAIS